MELPATRIPNLKQLLTIKIKQFIAQYRCFATDEEYIADEDSDFDENGKRKDDNRHNNGNRYFYIPPARDIYGYDEDKFLDELLESVIYHQQGSEIVRNLEQIDQILLVGYNHFTFTGRLFGQELQILIKAPFHKGSLGLSFGIDPLYMDQLLQAAAPRIFYKDVGYYHNAPHKTIILNNKVAIYYEDELVYLENDLPPDAIAAIQDLVSQPSPCYLTFECHNAPLITYMDDNPQPVPLTRVSWLGLGKNPKAKMREILLNYEKKMARGFRLYTIPDILFDWQPHLDKIKQTLDYLAQFGELKSTYADYYLATKYLFSFEYSPNDYLEIYGTREALKYLWLGASEEGFESLELAYVEQFKFLIFKSYFTGNISSTNFTFTYRFHFGSHKNQACYRFNIFWISETL
jgi:hypothetical protein